MAVGESNSATAADQRSVWQICRVTVSSGTHGSFRRVNHTAPMPIIDAHQHLWDLSRFRLPWVKPGTALARNYFVSNYHRAANGLEVLKTIYMEVDVDPAQQQDEADFVFATCRQPET